MTFEVKTVPECINYLLLEYQGVKYTLDEFSKKFRTREFELERLFPECKIIYRDKIFSIDEYKKSRLELSNQLDMFQRYREDIFPIEIHLAISNYSYYKAAKFLEKAENCLQTARLYFLESANIIEYDCNIPWKYGYQPIYDIRAMNFTTAIVWYNNCFDYILQIAFLAFELFEKMRRYRKEMTFEETLSLCTFKSFRDIHDSYLEDEEFNKLWNLLNTCHDSISDINTWANYAKHKGGIGYIGLKPESPFQVYTRTPDGVTESRTDEFESVKLDMDASETIVVKAHKALNICMTELVDFIDFESAKYSIDENGNFVIPEKSTYVKIQLGSKE